MKKMLSIFSLFSACAYGQYEYNTLECKMNSYFTRQNNPMNVIIEDTITAEIEIPNEIPDGRKIFRQNNKFKFKNLNAYKSPKHSYIHNLLNNSNELVLQNVPMAVNYDEGKYDFQYIASINGIRIFLFTENFANWQFQIEAPANQGNYLAYLDCHTKG